MFGIGLFKKYWQSRPVNFFDSNSGLPDELILNILSFLDIFSLYNASLSYKRLSVLSEDAQLWKCLCIRDFFNVDTKDENPNYKKIYQKKSSIFLTFTPPGEGAFFGLEKLHKWQLCYVGKLCQRIYCFISQNKNSLFKELRLTGNVNGGMLLQLEITDHTKYHFFKMYLSAIFSIDEISSIYFPLQCIATENPKTMKKLFRVFYSFNFLPEDHAPLVRKLIQSENWKHVTPLTKEEAKEIKRKLEDHL